MAIGGMSPNDVRHTGGALFRSRKNELMRRRRNQERKPVPQSGRAPHGTHDTGDCYIGVSWLS